MEDPKKTSTPTTPEGDAEGTKIEGGKGSYTQDDLNELAGKVRAEEKAKAEKKLAEEMEKIKKEAEEQKRLEALSAEERAREELKKERDAVEADRRAVRLEKNSLIAERELMKLNLKPELVEIVLDEDPDIMMGKIAKIKEQVKDGISAGVEQALKGTAPKDFGGDSQKTQGKKPVVKTSW